MSAPLIAQMERELAWARTAATAYTAYKGRGQGQDAWDAARTTWRTAVLELLDQGASQSLIAGACQVNRSLIHEIATNGTDSHKQEDSIMTQNDGSVDELVQLIGQHILIANTQRQWTWGHDERLSPGQLNHKALWDGLTAPSMTLTILSDLGKQRASKNPDDAAFARMVTWRANCAAKNTIRARAARKAAATRAARKAARAAAAA